MSLPRFVFLSFAMVVAAACTYSPIVAPVETTGHHPVPPLPEPDNWEELLPRQIEAVRESVAKWQDFEFAEAQGWKPFGGEEPLMGQHFYQKGGPDYVSGDALDFSRPNNLMYARIDGRMQLTGVAFVVRIGADELPPSGFAGPRDVWHVHDFLAAINAATEDRPFMRTLARNWLNDTYFNKGDDRYRLAMVHVWTQFPNPDGVFASYDRTLPYRKLSLPVSMADGVSLDTARGIDLASEYGCENALGGHAWIANLARAQERQLDEVCERSAERVRNALENPAAQLNRTAQAAWLDYQAVYDKLLTPEQKRRIAAMTEHGHQH